MGQTHGTRDRVGEEKGKEERAQKRGRPLKEALLLLIKRPVIGQLKGLVFLHPSPPRRLRWLSAGKSTSLPKPCREINAYRVGGGGIGRGWELE